MGSGCSPGMDVDQSDDSSSVCSSEESASSSVSSPDKQMVAQVSDDSPTVGQEGEATFQPKVLALNAELPAGHLPTVALRQPVPSRELEPREQESDLMERLAKGENCCDEQTNAVRLVSLGCYCGPKLSFQKMGRGAETLPFDWIRTRLDGVLHFLRTDFEGFFDFVTSLPVPDSPSMTMFRGPLHSFWHDDPTDPSMHERYSRRMVRFKEMGASLQQVLFVRVAVETRELLRAGELLGQLQDQFGSQARLLLILNFQETMSGPATVAELPDLMVYFLPSQAHARSSESFGQPYVAPVRCALDWAVGREVEVLSLPDLEAAAQKATRNDWGTRGLGGLDAFEGWPAPVAAVAAAALVAPAVPAAPAVAA